MALLTSGLPLPLPLPLPVSDQLISRCLATSGLGGEDRKFVVHNNPVVSYTNSKIDIKPSATFRAAGIYSSITRSEENMNISTKPNPPEEEETVSRMWLSV